MDHRRERQHFGAVMALAQAGRERHFRSVVVTGLYDGAEHLAEQMAAGLARACAVPSALFCFAPGRHRWKQYHPPRAEVLEEVLATPRRRECGASVAVAALGSAPATSELEGELPHGAPYDLVRNTVEELTEKTAMVVLSAPPLLTDPASLAALGVAPRLVLAVPALADRNDLTSAAKLLQSMNVDLIGSVLVGYRNPLPRWLDYLLGYR